MEEVDVKEARRLVEEEGALLVDCRERYEWDDMHIPAARLVPLTEFHDDPSIIEQLPLVVFHCAVGERSRLAAAIYESEHPDTRAVSLRGGIVAWSALGGPVQRQQS